MRAGAPDSQAQAPPIAPAWHTVALVTLIVLVAIAGTVLHTARPAMPANEALAASGRIVRIYIPMLLVQWGLAFYVSRVGRAENAAPALLGRGLNGSGRALRDVLAACALAVLIEACEWTFFVIAGPTAKSTRALLPTGFTEHAIWAVIAASTAFSEELVYRGYLRAQFAAFTGSGVLAAVIQALLFGLAHLEQGPAVALRFTVYAVLFALLASLRRSLWPGIICHGAIDLLSGFLRP